MFFSTFHPPGGAGIDTVVDEELPVTVKDTGIFPVLTSVAPNLF